MGFLETIGCMKSVVNSQVAITQASMGICQRTFSALLMKNNDQISVSAQTLESINFDWLEHIILSDEKEREIFTKSYLRGVERAQYLGSQILRR